MRTALTIAGSDPSGGAGVQGDLKTFAAHQVYGLSAVTAVTAQNTVGVSDVMPLPADFVTAQIEVVAADIVVHAVKTGMLADAAIVEAVSAAVEELELPNLVVDPVIASSSGAALLDGDGIQVLLSLLFPRARVVTPNIPEAEALSGIVIRSPTDMREAARRLHDTGPAAVIITGGHAEGQMVVDLLFDGHGFTELRARRVPGGGDPWNRLRVLRGSGRRPGGRSSDRGGCRQCPGLRRRRDGPASRHRSWRGARPFRVEPRSGRYT